MSIKYKTVIMCVVILIITVFLTSYFSYRATFKPTRDILSGNMEKLVEQVSLLFKHDIDISQEDMMIIFNRELTLGENGFVFIVDGSGKLIVHRKYQGENWKSKPHISLIMQKKNGSIRYRSVANKKWKIASFRYFPDKDYYIIASFFEDELLSKNRDLLIRSTIVSGVIILISLIPITFFFIRKQLMPYEIINTQVRDVMETRDLERRIFISTTDETARLS